MAGNLRVRLDGVQTSTPITKGNPMQNITIGRYKAHEGELAEGVTDIADAYDGWIEGTRDDGSTWIMWLDAHGNPEIFWARRDEGGGVEGDPVILA